MNHQDPHLIGGACVCMCEDCSDNGRCACPDCAHNEGSTLNSPAARYIRALAPKETAIVRCTCGVPDCDQQWHDLADAWDETPQQKAAWDAWIATNPSPEEMSRFMDGLQYDDDSPVEIHFSKHDHLCLECRGVVVSASVDGVNQPCGHRAGTRVLRKRGGDDGQEGPTPPA